MSFDDSNNKALWLAPYAPRMSMACPGCKKEFAISTIDKHAKKCHLFNMQKAVCTTIESTAKSMSITNGEKVTAEQRVNFWQDMVTICNSKHASARNYLADCKEKRARNLASEVDDDADYYSADEDGDNQGRNDVTPDGVPQTQYAQGNVPQPVFQGGVPQPVFQGGVPQPPYAQGNMPQPVFQGGVPQPVFQGGVPQPPYAPQGQQFAQGTPPVQPPYNPNNAGGYHTPNAPNHGENGGRNVRK
jgi:hypothetical protein